MSEDDSVKHESKWTRADLPSWVKIREADDMAGNGLRARVIDIALNEVVAHLNARFPKRDADALLYRAERAERERDQARKALVEKEDEAVRECRRAYRERDEAVARAEQAESELDHSLMEISEFREELATAYARAEKAERERDEWKARAEKAERQSYNQGGVRGADSLLYRAERAERERDEWKARAEQAEARVTASYPLHQPDGTHQDASHLPIDTDDDPAVFVVWESDLPEVSRTGDGWTDGTRHGWEGTSETAMECVETHLEWARFYAAAARAIEAESVVDPAEAKARVEADRRYSGDLNHAFIEGALWATRHLNEQGGER